MAACVLDADGRIMDANPALGELLGCAVERLKGRTLATIAYPEDVTLAGGALGTVFGQGIDRSQVDLRCVRLDNHKLIWGAWDFSLLRDTWGRPEFAVALVRDLSQAMQAEYERRFFEFMLRTIGAAEDSDAMLSDAIKTICHFTRCAMGQVWLPRNGLLVCSPAWHAARYGFDQLRSASTMMRYEHGAGLPGLVWTTGEPQQLADTDVHDPALFDRAHEAYRAGIREVMAVPLATPAGLIAVMEFFITPDRVGEPGRLERIGRVLAELGPIIQRKRVEEALRVSEERFRGVTDATLDAIVSADGDGRLRSWNRGAQRMFGWQAEEVLGRSLTVIVPERFRRPHVEGLARVRRTGQSKLAGSVVELMALRRDGSEFPIELSIGVWDDVSAGLSFSGVIRDITERKRAEEALATSRRELERTNAELETLVYSASHDLKSPMVSLLGYLEYLRLDYSQLLGEEGNHYLERMSDCTLYMQRLIHDLIDLSRVGRSGGELAEVDLGTLVRTIVDDAAAAHPGMEFRIGHLPVVTADPISFRQLYTNLIDNAVRHGGRDDLAVTIAAASHADGTLELWVSDDGDGIPVEHRERVFGVFERLDAPSTGGGTGMGLAICRKIVELLGGSIAIHDSLSAESLSDRTGTEARILLPAGVLSLWPVASPELASPVPEGSSLEPDGVGLFEEHGISA